MRDEDWIEGSVVLGQALVLLRTDRALLVDLGAEWREWVPCSQIERQGLGPDAQVGQVGELVVSAWLAREREWD